MNRFSASPLLLAALLGATLFSSVTATSSSSDSDDSCTCQLLERPNLRNKEETARWMVHSLDWGVLSTISTRVGNANVPFGNVYSFVDGTCDDSTGIPYFYGTYLDQTFQDTLINPSISLTLSEASLASVCGGSNLKGCRISSDGGFGDPENPLCARLVLTGTFVVLSDGDDELEKAKTAIFERHASMESWPKGHEWVVAKLKITDIWLIDFFGGATIMNVDDYLAVDMSSGAEESFWNLN